jgi:hypothetical protein
MALYQRKKVFGLQGQEFALLFMPILDVIFSTEIVCIGHDVNMDACCNSAELHRMEITLGQIFGVFYSVIKYMMRSNSRVVWKSNCRVEDGKSSLNSLP